MDFISLFDVDNASGFFGLLIFILERNMMNNAIIMITDMNTNEILAPVLPIDKLKIPTNSDCANKLKEVIKLFTLPII